MGRRWLLQVLAGVTMTLGLAAAPAAAQDLAPIDAVSSQVSGDPVTVDLPAGTGQVSVTPDAEERSLEAEATPVVSVSEAETTVAPKVTAGVSPSGPTLDVDGPTTVAGTPLPVGSSTDPVEETVGRPPASAPAAPAPVAGPRAAGSSPVAAAPAPSAPASASTTSGRASVPAGVSRGRATVSSSAPAAPYVDDTLAPQIAPPAVAAEAPSQVMALPVVDTTPDVPALLRLMTGLMVLGAGMTWRTVRQQLQA